MTRPRTIVATLACLGGLATGAALLAQQPAGGPRPAADEKEGLTGKALAEARLATAREAFEATMSLYQSGRAGLEGAPVWSRRLMDSEIRLAADPAARRAAIAAHRDRVRMIEQVAKARRESARGTYVDVLEARYERLEAEELLANAGAEPR